MSPQGQAVDYASERLYVADTGNDRVNVFKTSDLSFVFSFAVTDPEYLAVDNDELSTAFHSVYVISAGKVVKFNAAGEKQKEFGSGLFNTIRGIGVTSGGMVYVVDSKNEGPCPEGGGSTFKKRVLKFDHEGAFIETVEPNTAPCGQISAFAVDAAGNFYLVDEGARTLRKYDPSGSELCKETDPVIETRALGFDQAQRLLAAQRELGPASLGFFGHQTLTEYDTSCQVKRRFAYAKIPGLVNGIAARDAGLGATISEGSLGRFLERGPDPGPIVVPGRTVANTVKSVWAEMSGEVNPEGKVTGYRVDYVAEQTCEEDEASEGPEHCFDQAVKGSEEPLGASGFKVAAAKGALAGCKPFTQQALEEGKCLIPETTYRFRLTAKDEDGDEGSDEGEFTTLEPFEFIQSFASGVGIETAALTATLNPLGAPATGVFDYVDLQTCEEDEESLGPEHCFDQASQSKELQFGSGEDPVTRKTTIAGLSPDTAYRYRLVVLNPLLGEPVVEEAKTFATFPSPNAPAACANDAFRSGPGALLPDCRAHEMVSPIDKAGADLVVLFERKVANQAMPSGERLAYGSFRAFGDAASAPLTSTYLAERSAAGWQSSGIAPPQGPSILGSIALDFDFRAYSTDLCEAWLMPLGEPEPPLDAAATPGHRNLFRRLDGRCAEDGQPHYEAISLGEPERLGKVAQIDLQGHSADGQVTVFASQDNLSVGGAPAQPVGCATATIECLSRLYVKEAGSPMRYACVLPDKTKSANSCSAGSKDGERQNFRTGRLASLTGALSADGSRLYWTDSLAGPADHPEAGRIYLRRNPAAGGSECSGASRPCTVEVSKQGEEESGAPSHSSYFLAAAKDGSRAYYATGGGLSDLYEYDAATEASTLLTEGLAGYMGVAEDGLSLYFVSREDLTPGQENSEGDEAKDKAANLYRYRAGEGGGFSFIASLAEDDLTGFAFAGVANLNELSPVGAPGRRSSRVSPDGEQAIFTSVASLTGYDNSDASSPAPCGEAGGICDAELFRFDASAREGQGEIHCLSCNRSGGRPVGEELEPGFWAAGWIRGYETNLYASRNLSDDGNRVFFESSDALVARDTNSVVDVYQWEEPGTGTCKEKESSFVASAGGCIELISSGQSAHESSFIEASGSGQDVFFATLSSLYPADPGLVDIYDARVGGGFAAPEEEAVPCEGEGCQNPPPAPEFQPPTSSTYSGPGNLAAPKKKAKKCPKGKHKVKRGGKVRCVKKHKKKARAAHRRAHRRGP